MKIYGETDYYLFYWNDDNELIERHKATGIERKQVYRHNEENKLTSVTWETIEG